jgi:hypothetical protein
VEVTTKPQALTVSSVVVVTLVLLRIGTWLLVIGLLLGAVVETPQVELRHLLEVVVWMAQVHCQTYLLELHLL